MSLILQVRKRNFRSYYFRNPYRESIFFRLRTNLCRIRYRIPPQTCQVRHRTTFLQKFCKSLRCTVCKCHSRSSFCCRSVSSCCKATRLPLLCHFNICYRSSRGCCNHRRNCKLLFVTLSKAYSSQIIFY